MFPVIDRGPTGAKTYFLCYADQRGKYKQVKFGRACDLTKSGKPRTVPLSVKALGILQGLPRVNEYVFPSPITGKPFVSIFSSWNQARKRAGLEDVRIHDLRHSFASFMVNGGRSIYEVGRLLGHSQIKTTMRYAHLSEQTLAEAVNVVPLGEAA